MRACIENILLKHFKGRTVSALGGERERAREGLRGQKEHLDFDGLISYILTHSLQNAGSEPKAQMTFTDEAGEAHC